MRNYNQRYKELSLPAPEWDVRHAPLAFVPFTAHGLLPQLKGDVIVTSSKGGGYETAAVCLSE